MSADWYQCTKEEQALIASTKPGEVCILFGKHGVRKLATTEWGDIYVEAMVAATQSAAAQLGVRCLRDGDTVTLTDADMVEDRWDIELSTITVTLRATDGREGVGVAHLLPPDASVAVN